MYFLAERLEQKWNENNIFPSFCHNSNLPSKGGKLIRHDTSSNKKNGLASYKSQRPFTKDELFLLLYVDDGDLIFTNRSDAILDSRITFTQMKIMCLNIQAMFFLTRENIQN